MQTVIDSIRRWFRDPVFLLALAAGLIAFVVQSGELGTSDTQYRLQATHALWTSDPIVSPNDYPSFGVRGRGGKILTGNLCELMESLLPTRIQIQV